MRAAGLALAYLLLTLGMTYPLVRHFRDAVPGPPWDNLVWLYDLWWTKRTILAGQGGLIFNPGLFVPYGYDLRLSETMLANKLLVAPILALGDVVVAYNALVVLLSVLTGLGMYLLVSQLTRSRTAGWISGTIFAFAPYRMHALAAGWLPLLATQWLPLLFWSLERGIRRRELRWFVVSGVFLAANALSSWYYAYVVGPFALLYALLRWRPWRSRIMAREALAGLALMLVVAGALVGPVAYPLLRGAGRTMAWSLADVEKWSASAEDFLLPQVYQPLWGRAALALRPQVPGYPWYVPGFVGLGFVPLVLGGVGLWRWRREPALGAFLVCGALALVVALGPTLHWGGQRVYVSVPPAVERTFARAMYVLMGRLALNRAPYGAIARPGAVPVPLPGLLLYLWLPFAAALRTMYRFGLITLFAVAVAAGYGVEALLVRCTPSPPAPSPPGGRGGDGLHLSVRGGGGILLALVLTALVCLEFAVVPLGCGYTEIVEQPLDRWLAALPAGTRLAQFPLVRALNGSALYRSRTHGQPIAYGHGTFYPPAYTAAMPVLGRFPSAETLDLLRSWDVRYVVVGVGAYEAGLGDLPGETWAQVAEGIEQSARLRLVYTAEELPVWRGERVADLIRGNLPVQPVVVDRVQVYELLR